MSILANNNGNKYQSNYDMPCVTSGYKKRKYLPKAKYNKFNDMPLTSVQKKQVLAMAKRQAIGVQEMKYFDQFAANTGLSQSGTLIDISPIPQNTTVSADVGREGDEVYIRDIELRVRVETTTEASPFNAAARVLLIQSYEDTTMTTLTYGGIMQGTGAATSYLSPYNHDRRRVFKILYDEIFSLSDQGPSQVNRVVKVYPGKKKIRFVGSSAGGEGKIFLLAISDSAAGTVSFDYWTRLNFNDA